jgi:phosphoglycolate phosphatase-like HAD superfamily hydrolase
VSYEHCVVIGDTPKDVECAHVHGASAIAVATGTYPLKELEKTDAELVTADLSNTETIVDWIRRK